MAPIHDTDLAEKRWERATWDTESFEFWEKVEVRLRKQRVLWILGTALLFLVISSIPIAMDRYLKWGAVARARQISELLSQAKTLAITEKKAIRVRFISNEGFQYEIASSGGCSSKEWQTLQGFPGILEDGAGYALLDPEEGRKRGYLGLSREFCYDPAHASLPKEVLMGSPGPLPLLYGIGVIPVKDLTDGRSDRLSILLVKGPTADFELSE